VAFVQLMLYNSLRSALFKGGPLLDIRHAAYLLDRKFTLSLHHF